jgi:hypothetical protein
LPIGSVSYVFLMLLQRLHTLTAAQRTFLRAFFTTGAKLIRIADHIAASELCLIRGKNRVHNAKDPGKW